MCTSAPDTTIPAFFHFSSGEINKECDLLLCLHEREETKANTFLSIFQEPSSNLSAYKKSGDKKARPQRPRLKKGHFLKPSRTFTTNCFWRVFGAEFCVPFMSTYGYDPLSLGTFYYERSHTFYHHDHEWPEQTSVFFFLSRIIGYILVSFDISLCGLLSSLKLHKGFHGAWEVIKRGQKTSS